MNRQFSMISAALGLFSAACGGSSAIGEAGSGGNASGGSAGTAEGGSGGPDTGGTVGTGGRGGAATGGAAGPGGTGGSETGGAAGTAGSEQGGTSGSAAGGAGGTTPGAIRRPCEVLEGAGQTCVAAHSTVRVLVRSYSGPLYQVQRADLTTRDIGSVDGYADVATQDEFCVDASCVVTMIYDQTAYGHHLTPSPPGSAKSTPGKPALAHRHPVTINGRDVYGLMFRPGEGYRAACDDCPYPEGRSFTAVGDEPQTIYMVSSQHDLINGCCLDYGNAERSSNNDGNGHMEAVYLGLGVIWGSGVGEGPWVMADLENGLFPGWENGQSDNISTNTAVEYDFVTAVLVGDTADKNAGKGRFALYGGDAASGALKTMYDGIRPERPGYVPMQKQGSIVLSISGDNSDGDGGRFYEGVMANGAASRETVDALQAAIVAAGYGR